ncbi:MAG: lysophospholipid acyltransferase family protein [Planctomycetota bacterium]
MKKRSRFRHSIEYAGLYLVYLAVNLLPYRATHPPARFIAWLGFAVFRMRRRETVVRIMTAMGVDRPAAVRIAWRAYFNIAAAGLEFLRFRRLRPVFDAGYIRVEGLEPIRRLAAEGRGAVLAAMHSGSWEICGAALAYSGIPLFYVTGVQHNPRVDALINAMRRSVGIELIPRDGALKQVFRRLGRGEFLGIVADQHIAGESVTVDFFGKSCTAPKGPAAFAWKTGVPVIPLMTVREGTARHRLLIMDPILPDQGRDRDGEIARITQAYTAVFEKVIREHPGDWFWLHRRWR